MVCLLRQFACGVVLSKPYCRARGIMHAGEIPIERDTEFSKA